MPELASNLLLIGRIGRAHGVRGELKVQPVTDDPGRFEDLARVFVGADPGSAREMAVARVRYQYPKGQTIVLLSLEGVADRDVADGLRNAGVYAAATELPELEEDELYLHDLVGLSVVMADDAGRPKEPLGTVRDVFEGAAQDLLAIARPGRPDVLLPDVPEFVLSVDREAGVVLVRPPEGLLEE